MNLRTVLLLTMISICTLLSGQENPENTSTPKSLFDTKIDLNKGTTNWAAGVASVVFDKNIPENQKTAEFYVFKQDNDLLVNQETPMMKDNTKEGDNIKNCETLKKTCRSEKCVTDALIEILGNGDRNVLIKYERKLLSVQIFYTYQDCQ
ncbi:hypothetical protein ACFQZJ_00945 [Maribacter chungangensis]|uniref:Uncharacterized protein n=1 Tax=Maribacter chungangensis TaxID=1069117 RepID=A0ABW3AYM8_9FLAO